MFDSLYKDVFSVRNSRVVAPVLSSEHLKNLFLVLCTSPSTNTDVLSPNK